MVHQAAWSAWLSTDLLPFILFETVGITPVCLCVALPRPADEQLLFCNRLVLISAFPANPDTANVAVAPNHVTMPIGVAIVESQIEFGRQFGDGGHIQTDTRTQGTQIFNGAVVPNIRILRQNFGWLSNLCPLESATFNHASSPNWQITQNSVQFC
jgi:hypothetical protein